MVYQMLLSGYKLYAKSATILFKFFNQFLNFKFPPTVRIESTNLCNANCITCPRKSLTRKTGIMDFELYKKIIDECTQYKIRRVHLHNFGEPLLDRKLTEKIQYAKNRGIKTRIFSNFSLLTQESAIELVRSGLDDLKISFDGYTKETFEYVRRKLQFEDVVNNIRLLIETKKQLKSKTPKIVLTFVETPLNHSEKKLFLREWHGVVDDIVITKVHNWGGEIKDKVEEKLIPCPRIWTTFTILWNGDVALCCLDFDGKVIFGNVRTQSIFDIYHSDQMKTIRNYHLTWQYDKIPICKNCDIRK